MSHLLPILLLVPIVGAFTCLVVPERAAKWVGLATSLAIVVLVLPLSDLAFGDERLGRPPYLVLEGTMGPSLHIEWHAQSLLISGLDAGLRLGCDAISWWLILLTAFLQPLAILGSFAGIQQREKSYYFWLTLLLTPMIGTFIARDGLAFYLFFELTLVPMFFLIGLWGGDQRLPAAIKFFIFTFVGGVFTLAAILYLGLAASSFAFEDMTRHAQEIADPSLKVVLLLALFVGFAVKTPLFPFHTWLPLAHTVAPTAGSVILAGVLLKLGTYGILKLAIPMGLLSSTSITGVDVDGLMPVMRDTVVPLVGLLCVVGIIYGALICWVQQDIKKLIAYSSVSHLGFCVLGLIALNAIGMQGGVFYMISHGISTGALFLMVGMLYDRYHTRMFHDYGGLGRVMPGFSAFFVLFALASIGLPGTNGFISEFLAILGAFSSPRLGPLVGSIAAIGVILGAIYMLHMVARVVFGPLRLPEAQAPAGHAFAPTDDSHHIPQAELARPGLPAGLPRDLGPREITVLAPLAVVVILLGVLPQTLLRSILPGIDAIRLPGIQQLELQVPPEPPTGPATGGNVMGEVAPDVGPDEVAPPPE